MTRVVVAHNASEEAADGLALAELIIRLTDADLVIARVLRDMVDRAVQDPSDQRRIRRHVIETRRAVVAALPQETDPDVVALPSAKLARSLHAFAEAEDATFLIVGSSHRHGLGRRLLGGSAELIVDGAPCPVAVAPPGYHARHAGVPSVVSVGYDGRPHSRPALHVAESLAQAARATLRVLTAGHEVPEELPGVLLPPARVERVRLDGDAGRAPVAETAAAGLLVLGSRGLGPVRRTLLGSVSAHVLTRAHCPVIVCPPAA
jgi:nucleotide-binding universal stress UspA family protein